MWLDLLAVLATAAGFAAAVRGRAADRGLARWTRRPETWLILVCGLIFANQVLVNVYVIQVRHGDATFITQYLPPGYFALEDAGWMRRLASWFPHPGLLSVTVLRTQPMLELPFGLLIYLTVARWLDPALMRRLTGWWALGAASVAYTVVFCLIEVDLANPYTRGAIAVRAVSAVITPLVLGAVLRSGHEPAVRSLPQVLTFVVSAAALGVIVLVLYDTVLLYSLGKVGREAPLAGIALAALVLARLTAARLRSDETGPCLAVLIRATWHGLQWFFVPALTIRYALLGYGSRPLAMALVALIAGAAVVAATCGTPRRVLWAVAATAVLAAVGAAVATLTPATHVEIRLLAAAVAFVVIATAAAATFDRVQDLGAFPEP